MRQKIDLKLRLRQISEDIDGTLLTIMNHFGVVTAGRPPLEVLAAYELFSRTTLARAGTTWTFTEPVSPVTEEITALRKELESLKLSQKTTVLSADSLRELTMANVTSFDNLTGRPKWMRDATASLQRHLAGTTTEGDTIRSFWAIMLEAHFSFRTGAQRQLNFAGAPSLPDALAKGAQIVTERINGRIIKVVEWDGKRYYAAQRTGKLYDMSSAPPGNCDTCGATHWFWECAGAVEKPPSN